MRMMITGGGTGGHTSPALAIIEQLKRRDSQLILQWVGCRDSIEERVCRSEAIPFRSVPVVGWPRVNSLRKISAAARLSLSAARALFLLWKFRPQAVLGVGGYVSVPLVLVAQRIGIPTILHEQNKQLGMANQLLARRTNRLLLSYPETVGDYDAARARLVGNPVREGFLEPPDRDTACRAFGLDPEIPVVLVCGGSQGAHTLNKAMSTAIEMFSEGEIQFIWMTGQTDAADARARAHKAPVPVDVHAFIDDMASACSASSLIVSRAGASSSAEIAMLGKPSILIPYPHATDNHQEQNARAFEAAEAAVVLLDEECTGERLAHTMQELLSDGERLKTMGANALTQVRPATVETIVEEILSLVFETRNE